ncbi:MAG TPA: hypothetical protein VL178_10515 [Pseudomonas sp.]|nr:hypothetical protein [Pseudomonas sp.]
MKRQGRHLRRRRAQQRGHQHGNARNAPQPCASDQDRPARQAASPGPTTVRTIERSNTATSNRQREHSNGNGNGNASTATATRATVRSNAGALEEPVGFFTAFVPTKKMWEQIPPL